MNDLHTQFMYFLIYLGRSVRFNLYCIEHIMTFIANWLPLCQPQLRHFSNTEKS